MYSVHIADSAQQPSNLFLWIFLSRNSIATDCVVETVTPDCGIYNLCFYDEDEVQPCSNEFRACENSEPCIMCLDNAEDSSECEIATCAGQADMLCCLYGEAGETCTDNAKLLAYTGKWLIVVFRYEVGVGSGRKSVVADT